MSKIEINSFSGIRPVISADKLAGIEAQTAANCNFRSGSLELLASADIPSKTVSQFSFVDGFGTWTLAGTAFKLGNNVINQSAPNAPVVSATSAFTQASVTGTAFLISATAPSGTPTAPVTATPASQQTGFLLNGTRLTVTYTLQPTFIGITTTAIANAFSAFTRSASLTIAGQAFTTIGQEVDLTGGVGRIKLENLDYSTATITWKKDEAGVYRAYVSEWTVTFEFGINYVTDLALERAVVYRLTMVETNGMESPASDPSSIVAIMPNNYAVVSNLTVGKTKRLYRAAGTEMDAKYYFVAELASGVASYKDLIADADLGEVMPETENPPTVMTQVVWLPGGFCAGFYGKDIYFSEPFKLYSWPSKYTLTTQKTIVGLGVMGNDLYVLSTPPSSPDTDANNYILTGVAPEVMTMSELAVNEGCSTINSICKVGTTIGFASPTGYILITGGRGKNITEPFYSKSQWAALTPAGMIAKESDSQIFIYNATSAGIIIDYLNGTVRTFTTTTPTTFTWRSKAFVSELPIELHVAQLVGASGTHTLTLYADGNATPVFTGTITAGTDLVITRGLAAAKRWEIQIAGGSTRVDNLAVIHRERIMVNGPMFLTKANTEGSWRRLMFQFPQSGRFKVVRARASAYNVVSAFYKDSTLDHTQTMTSDADYRINTTGTSDNDLWEIDTTCSGEIYDLMVIPRTVQEITGPVVLSAKGRLSWMGNVFHFPRLGYFEVARIRGAPGATLGTLNLRSNEADTVTLATAISSDTDVKLAATTPNDLWEVDVSGNGLIDEVVLWPQAVAETNSPVIHVKRGENQSPATWLGNEYRYPEPIRLRTAQVKSEVYPVTLTITCDGSAISGSPYTVADAKEFRLSYNLSVGRVWGFDAVVTGVIDSVTLWAEQLIQPKDAVVTLKYDGVQGQVSTLAKVIEFAKEDYFSCARVHASAYPVTLKFYRDGGKTVYHQKTVTNDNGFWLPKWQPARQWEIDVISGSGIIYTVTLAKSMIALRA